MIALAHCGWRSTEEKLIEKVVDEMIARASQAENILVMIGPGIHKESYRHSEIKADILKWKGFIKQKNNEFEIDLVGYNVFQLKEKGILNDNIKISLIDTAADETYFSHYRVVRTGEKEGRFCTVVGMRE